MGGKWRDFCARFVGRENAAAGLDLALHRETFCHGDIARCEVGALIDSGLRRSGDLATARYIKL